jgi:hypothetical protein
MTKEEIIKTCIELKRRGLTVRQIAEEIAEFGFKTRYGNSPTRSTIAYWLSVSGEDLPDLRKQRERKSEAHYKQKRSEANRRYRTKNRERLNEYSRNYYQTYIKGS